MCAIQLTLLKFCFIYREQDNVIVSMELELDKGQFERGRSLEASGSSLERLLQDTVSTGRVGALTLDPNYLVFEPHQGIQNIDIKICFYFYFF